MDVLPHYTQPASLQGFEYSFTSLGKRKIHILHKITLLPDSSPAAGCAPAVLLLRPALVGLRGLSSPQGSQRNCFISHHQIHPPPCKYPPTDKSHEDLEAKHERCSRCGCLEKNTAKGPSSQTPLVNATGVHKKSSGKISPLQACTTGLRAARGRSHGNWQRGDTGEQQDCQTIQLQSRNQELQQESSSPPPPALQNIPSPRNLHKPVYISCSPWATDRAVVQQFTGSKQDYDPITGTVKFLHMGFLDSIS